MVGQKFRTRCFLDVTVDGDPIGRIVLELFNDTCPKAAENFKKLCQGGCGLGLKTGKPLSYQGSIFHRVIKGFMVQGGDFSNKDGTGGESIYGGTFADECLSTPHDRPFLLSMANRGPNTNGSQFFITTAPAPHLNGKHVVFGHVLSGEDVVRKVEAVPIADTKAHRPVKLITIASCGELIPVKKKKKESSEKEKKKKKKEKKRARKNLHHEHTDEEENSVECSVRPEEVPEIPLPKFLYRGNLDPVKKNNDGDNNNQRHIAEAVSRELLRATRERHNDKSGRKIKGRGRMCYRSPGSRSESRGRSVTPPHWRQASQTLQKMDESDWKKWHAERNAIRAQELSSEKPSSLKTGQPRDTSLSPSMVSSARNRSPSGSPCELVENHAQPSAAYTQNYSQSKRVSPPKRSRGDRSPLTDKSRVPETIKSSPLSKIGTAVETHKRKSHRMNSTALQSHVINPQEEVVSESIHSKDFKPESKQHKRLLNVNKDGSEEENLYESPRIRNNENSFTERSQRVNGITIRSPVGSPPIRRSPAAYRASPVSRTNQHELIGSLEYSSPTAGHVQRAADSPHSEASEIFYARSRPCVVSPLSGSRKAPLPCSPNQPKSSTQLLRLSRSPKSPGSYRRSRKDEVEPCNRESAPSPLSASVSVPRPSYTTPLNSKAPAENNEHRSKARHSPVPAKKLPSRSSCSGSASCSSDDYGRSRSRSHSVEKVTKRTVPRSPPAHLLQKWRMRHEQLIQKRRIAPSASSTFHTPSLSSEERSRHDRRLITSNSRHSRSGSRSTSCSPPRRRKQRSSTSHSRSGSPSHKRSRHIVSLQRDIPRSPTPVTAGSRDASAESKHSALSPHAPRHVRHQATSPVNISKKGMKMIASTQQSVTEPPTSQDSFEPSKWEKAELAETASTQHNSWTTSHWQTSSDPKSAPILPVTDAANSDTATSVSVLQRLRLPQPTKPLRQLHSPEPSEDQSVTPNEPVRSDTKELAQSRTHDVAGPSFAVPRDSSSSVGKSTTQVKSLPQRQRSSSTSGSVDSSASSTSGTCSSHTSCSRSRTGLRRSLSPLSRRRSDFSDSRSRGRGSYYGRYSPISRSRYSRSRSRSTYRSTIHSAYSSNRTRNRSSSQSRSRSYSRYSRSPSSRWAGSSNRHRRGRRSHRYSGFRRRSSTRSRSSSCSSCSSSRHR